MWKFNNWLFPLVLLLVGQGGFSQTCDLRLSGHVLDEHSGEPLPYVTILDVSTAGGVVTDEKGYFVLDSICPGETHLRVNHLGCEELILYFQLKQDSSIEISLHHNAELLGEVLVMGEHSHDAALGSESMNRNKISRAADQNIGMLLTEITGISAIQNGASVAKPILNGMSGNRLTILNNGIAQSGQQWGSDHAPEVDAFATDQIRIIKGIHTMAYSGSNLGSMISLEMNPIPKDPHIHGIGSYAFNANGQGHTGNLRLEKDGKWAAWRLSLTGKKSGDGKSPDYFLTNTGSEESNAAIQVEKSINKAWNTNFYYSFFKTKIGILRGSHIGNVTDLLSAFSREVPFYTSDEFSYEINAPRQEVIHQLAKLSNEYRIDEQRKVVLTYAFQRNERQEFDVRRSGRTDIPALDLQQDDHSLSLSYDQNIDSTVHWNSGMQYRYTWNANDPETGIIPLIPDYSNRQYSLFTLADKVMGDWTLGAGLRYDLKNIYALTISDSVPRVIERLDLWYSNPSAALSARYDAAENLQFEFELSYRQRAPEVNELFSGGLHQGVSGIEEGDSELKSEQGLQAQFTTSYQLNHRFFFDLSTYINSIQDYIYLVPQEELRLTIRGAFPLFNYEQVDARLIGADLRLRAELTRRLRAQCSYAYIQGVEAQSGLGLVGIPANSGWVKLSYDIPKTWGLTEMQMGIRYAYVSQRNDLETSNHLYPNRPSDSPLMGQDFVAPPPAYGLVNMDWTAEKILGKNQLQIGLSVMNLMNTKYRSYLDRQRYFSDARGRELKARIALIF